MIDPNTVDPMPPVDGAELLDDLHTALRRYVAFPDAHSSVAVTLWTVVTHALPAFECAPRLVVTSPEKRCGKTRLLDIIEYTCHRKLVTVNAAVAAIFRSIGGDHPPTLLVDEADAIFGSKKAAENNEDFRALLNAGHQRGRSALRCVGPLHTPTEFPTFAMAAIVGIGAMPDTITDRGVNVTMRRRATGEKVSQFRSRRDGPKLEKLRDRLAAWTAEHVDDLSKAEPEMPVEDRAADTWEPLIAVADAAGGHWPESARAACRALVAAADAADEDRSEGVKLLTDIKAAFAGCCVSFLRSEQLVTELRRMDESPWNDYELTRSKLSYRLREFDVRTRHNPAGTARGYRLEDFADAFARYTRQNSSEPSESQARQDSASDGLKNNPSESDGSDGLKNNPSESDGSDGLKNNPSDDTPPFISDSDGLTFSDGYAARNGTPLSGCPCGRPAPVNPETGLCHWCELKASKRGAT